MTSPHKAPAVPVRFAAGVGVLVLVLAVVLVVVLTGGDSGDGPRADTTTSPTAAGTPSRSSALREADAQFPGLVLAGALSRNHASRGERIDYPEASAHPPLGGNHASIWINCQAYSAPIPNENAVHSLEHGAVWITYRPGLDAATVSALDGLARQGGSVLVSPYAQDAPVVLTAWGRQLALMAYDPGVVARFVEAYVDGPQDPEPGASCESPVNEPGTAPWVLNNPSGPPEASTSTVTVPASGTIS